METVEQTSDWSTSSQTGTTGGSKTPLVIGGGLLVLLAVGYALSSGSGDSSESDAQDEAVIAADNQYFELFFAARDLPIRTSRSESAPESGQLSRGEQVATKPPVDGWVELANGGFVRVADLRPSAPPQIDRSTLDDYFTLESVQVLAAPESGAASITSIDKLKRVSVLGTVNSDYAEIVTDSGEVGYVNWESFGGIGGKGRSAWVAVNNRCSRTKNIAFSFTINGTRTAHVGHWTFVPSVDGQIEYSDAPGERIYVDSVFNFFADLGDDFHLRSGNTVVQQGDDKVLVNGGLVEMQRMVAELTPDGAYQVTFC